MKTFKKVLIGLGIIIALLVIITLIAFINVNNKTKNIRNDYSSIYTDSKYQQSVLINNANYIKQDVSCGYAVIEMFAKWNGNNNLTEKTLYDEYGKVVTSTGKSFEKEMNKQFPEYETTMYKYLSNTELIDKVYTSLSNGIPVPFEWAAKLDGVWTLHYSLIVGMDIPNDTVTILNPYGYEEKITIKELLDRTSYEAYENMPVFLKFGFAFGIFEKNTIFIVTRKA